MAKSKPARVTIPTAPARRAPQSSQETVTTTPPTHHGAQSTANGPAGPEEPAVESSPANSTEQLEDVNMEHPPASPDSNTPATLTPAQLDRISTIPEELQFFLDANLNLDKKPCTKATFLRILQHFHPTFKPPAGHSRPFLVQAYKRKVLPIISAYSSPKESDSDSGDSGEDVAMEAAPIQVSLAGINPNNPSITIDIILQLISERHPKLRLPKTMKKKSAIAYFHQYIMPPPKGGYPAPFTTPPPLVPAPYHKLLTKEELRFAIHCHAHEVFVPDGSTKERLEAIYVQYVLVDIHEGDPIFEGVHYYIVHPKQAEK